jgi:hypothetical protein
LHVKAEFVEQFVGFKSLCSTVEGAVRKLIVERGTSLGVLQALLFKARK